MDRKELLSTISTLSKEVEAIEDPGCPKQKILSKLESIRVIAADQWPTAKTAPSPKPTAPEHRPPPSR